MNEIISDLKSISANARETFGKLSAEQLNWKPNAETWSVAQIFEHLIILNNLYLSNIQKVVNGTHRNNFFSKIPFISDLLARSMKSALDPAQKRKTKTFKIFEPSASNISPAIIENFVENNKKLIEMIEAAKNLDVHKIKIPTPLNSALNLRLNDAFEILTIHEKRHFLQAEGVLQAQNL